MGANLPVNAQRLWADVMALADITDPGEPYTRRACTARFLEGRAFLAERFAEAGLAVRIDPAGNLIGRRPGRAPGKGVILIGSHSDTVPGGGRFDGVAAALAMGVSAAPWRAAMAVGAPSQAMIAAWLVEEAEKGGAPSAMARLLEIAPLENFDYTFSICLNF